MGQRQYLRQSDYDEWLLLFSNSFHMCSFILIEEVGLDSLSLISRVIESFIVLEKKLDELDAGA